MTLSERARAAGKASAAKRWAGHTPKDPPVKQTREQIAERARAAAMRRQEERVAKNAEIARILALTGQVKSWKALNVPDTVHAKIRSLARERKISMWMIVAEMVEKDLT